MDPSGSVVNTFLGPSIIRAMKHDLPQFKLRLPADLKDRLETAAAEKDRTLTAEIVARLEASFTANEDLVDTFKLLIHQAAQELVKEQK